MKRWLLFFAVIASLGAVSVYHGTGFRLEDRGTSYTIRTLAGVDLMKVDTNGRVVQIDGVSATIAAGTGSPETVVTAPVGSVYMRTDGVAGTILYLKETGAAATGWVPVTSGGADNLGNHIATTTLQMGTQAIDFTWTTLPDGATPSVAGLTTVKLGGATQVTNFNGGVDGQLLYVDLTAGQSIANNATIATTNGAAINGPGLRAFVRDGTVWMEQGPGGNLIHDLSATITLDSYLTPGRFEITADNIANGPSWFSNQPDTLIDDTVWLTVRAESNGSTNNILQQAELIDGPNDVMMTAQRNHNGTSWSAWMRMGGFRWITMANSATPSTQGSVRVKTGGTTAITNFTGGVEGQELTVLIASTHQVNNGATIATISGANIAGPAVRLFALDGSVWREQVGGADNLGNHIATTTLAMTNNRISTLHLGTVGSPSVSFNGDPNTGVYSPAADQVGISVGGAETMRSEVNRNYLHNAVVHEHNPAQTPDGSNDLDVSNKSFITMASGPTTVDKFINGVEGQILYVLLDSDDTIVDSTADIQLAGGTNFTPSGHCGMIFILRTTTWYELSRTEH
jgi:hypothetical protein